MLKLNDRRAARQKHMHFNMCLNNNSEGREVNFTHDHSLVPVNTSVIEGVGKQV